MSALYIASYEFNGTGEGELSVVVEELLIQHGPVSDGWILVQRSSNSNDVGYVPLNYLEKISDGMDGEKSGPVLSPEKVVESSLDQDRTNRRVLSSGKTFQMEKDFVAVIPAEMDQIALGLGWTTPQQNLDLDASCLFFDGNLNCPEGSVLYFGNKSLYGATSCGDNRTGQGEGDDERILLNLSEIPADVHHLALTVSIYSDDRSFSEVHNSYVRLLGSEDCLLAKYNLDDSGPSQGLCFATLSRKGPTQWFFKTKGAPIRGKRGTDRECIEDVQAILRANPSEIVLERTEGDDVEFALKWDILENAQPVDLDAQAVMFDEGGRMLDAVYYNQLSACGGTVKHSGDDRTGAGTGDDESIRVDFDRLPMQVKMIAVVVTAFSGGTFQSVNTATIETRNLTEDGPKVLGSVSIGCKGENTAVILCVLHLNPLLGQWCLHEVGDPVGGKHFQDCLNDIRLVVDCFLDPDQTCSRVLSTEKIFMMHKNNVAFIPAEHDQITLGVGWTPNRELDLDASCIFMDRNFEVPGWNCEGCTKRNIGLECLACQAPRPERISEEWVLYFGNRRLPGAQHEGDELSGKGEGDDERLLLTLSKIPESIHHLAFTVNIYTLNSSFSEVTNSYARLLGNEDRVLAIYKVDDSMSTSCGLCFAILSRNGPGQWAFKVFGAPVRGRRGKDPECIEDVQALLRGMNAEDETAPMPPETMENDMASIASDVDEPNEDAISEAESGENGTDEPDTPSPTRPLPICSVTSTDFSQIDQDEGRAYEAKDIVMDGQNTLPPSIPQDQHVSPPAPGNSTPPSNPPPPAQNSTTPSRIPQSSSKHAQPQNQTPQYNRKTSDSKIPKPGKGTPSNRLNTNGGRSSVSKIPRPTTSKNTPATNQHSSLIGDQKRDETPVTSDRILTREDSASSLLQLSDSASHASDPINTRETSTSNLLQLSDSESLASVSSEAQSNQIPVDGSQASQAPPSDPPNNRKPPDSNNMPEPDTGQENLVLQQISDRDIDFAFKWEYANEMPAVDLDAQAIMFDETGRMVDSASFDQLSACDGSVVHSGDNRGGGGKSDGETIKVNFSALPINVKAFAFVLAAFSGGSFLSVDTVALNISFATPDGPKVLGTVSASCQQENTALLLCIVYFNPDLGEWCLHKVNMPAEGRHFEKCLGSVQRVIDSFLDPDTSNERELSTEKVFIMHKSDVALIPQQSGQITIGLGWTTPQQKMDLDASCLFLNKDLNCPEGLVLYYNNKSLPGAHHCGDNQTGAEDGDDERIIVNLPDVPSDIQHLVFTVNVFSNNGSFSQLFNSYIRILEAGDQVLALYKLDGSFTSRGLCFGVLSRKGSDQWIFKAIEGPVRGKRGIDPECLEDVQALFRASTEASGQTINPIHSANTDPSEPADPAFCLEQPDQSMEMTKDEARVWMTGFYVIHNPDKLSSIDEILEHEVYREQSYRNLISDLKGKYVPSEELETDQLSVQSNMTKSDARIWVTGIYHLYNSTKLGAIEEILESEEYKRDYRALVQHLTEKYGISRPSSEESTGTGLFTQMTKEQARLWVTGFYLLHNPDKLATVEKILGMQKYTQNNYIDIVQDLEDKYAYSSTFETFENEKSSEKGMMTKYQARIWTSGIYSIYNPDKQENVEGLLELDNYKKDYKDLVLDLMDKYGIYPTPPVSLESGGDVNIFGKAMRQEASDQVLTVDNGVGIFGKSMQQQAPEKAFTATNILPPEKAFTAANISQQSSQVSNSWVCSHCTFKNAFFARQSCSSCGLPKDSDHAGGMDGEVSGAGMLGTGSGGITSPDPDIGSSVRANAQENSQKKRRRRIKCSRELCLIS